jgi:hypothetical protein
MRLEGWNAVPDGYGAWFEISRAPWWLRLWFRTPIVDKFAYPVLVRRGFGNLTPDPGWAPEHPGEVGPGWTIAPQGQEMLSLVDKSRPIARPGGLRRRRRRYARQAWRHHFGRGMTLPTRIHLPGGRVVERHNYLFWRIRLPMLAALGMSGVLVGGWPGLMLGLGTGVLIEALLSYRRPFRPTGTGSSA